MSSSKPSIAGLPESGKETMRAAVYYGKEDIRIEDVPRPVPKDNEVLVRCAYNGICGTDLHEVGCPALPDGETRRVNELLLTWRTNHLQYFDGALFQ